MYYIYVDIHQNLQRGANTAVSVGEWIPCNRTICHPLEGLSLGIHIYPIMSLPRKPTTFMII